MDESSRTLRSLRFSRAQRVCRGVDFERVLAHGKRAADAGLAVWALANGLPVSRLGLMVGRRFGNAVRRNRAKRVIRDAFRLLQYELPPGVDWICSPTPGIELNRDAAMQTLRRLAARLTRSIKPFDPSRPRS